MTETPDWIFEYIKEGRRLFGVNDDAWHVFVKMTDRPLGSADNYGGCIPDSVYMNADLEFNETLVEGWHSKRVVFHEILHIAHSIVDHVVEDMIEELPDGKREIYRKLHVENLERFIQMVSRNTCLVLEEMILDAENNNKKGKK